MKKLLIIILSTAFIIVCWSDNFADDIKLSPSEDIFEFVSEQLNQAEKSINVCVFIFDYKPLADLLIEAQKKGIEIRVITDFRSVTLPMRDAYERYNESLVGYLMKNDIKVAVYKGKNKAIMHNKFVIIDGIKIMIGSYNFQKEAQPINQENLLITSDSSIIQKLIPYFETLSKDTYTYVYSSQSEIRNAFYIEYTKHVTKSAVKFFLMYLAIPLFLCGWIYRYKIKKSNA